MMNRFLLFPILIFFIASPLFAAQLRSQHDVEPDNSALTLLHNTVAEMLQNEPKQGLEKIADKFPLTNHTDFSINTEVSIKKSKSLLLKLVMMNGRLLSTQRSVLTRKMERLIANLLILMVTESEIS
ncbi:MAG: hypothetical protein ACRCYL_17455 [Kluyvera sp.]